MDMIEIGRRLSFACRARRPNSPEFYSIDSRVFDALMRNWSRWINR